MFSHNYKIIIATSGIEFTMPDYDRIFQPQTTNLV